MNRMTRLIGLAVAGVTALFAAGAWADSELHGRVSFADESGLIKGQEDSDWSYAALNTLVMPGDTIWADDKSALEMEFSGGTFVRLADGSRIDVLDVPPNGLFRGDVGSFYVQRVSRSNGEVLFDSPVGSISIEPDSQVRIDILEGGATTVTVRWGRALVHSGGSEPIAVNAGTQSFIDPGYLPSEPATFDRSLEDSFDTWNRERGRYFAQGSTPAPIDYGSRTSAPLGVSELQNYGEWVYVDSTPYWRPTVVVNYVPYRDGYWSYVPRHGYVWCDNYPFAYTTTHYGHWRHHAHHGWIWGYSGHYRPAYAYTVSYGDYFVWAPLGYDGYPVYSSAYAGFTIGSVSFSYGWSSYAYHYDVFHCRPSVFAVNYNFIYDSHRRHRYNNHNYWRIEADSRPYRDAGRPHWPGDTPRTYQPDRVYRGVTLADGSGRTAAPERARQLEARRPERVARAQGPEVRPTRSTPIDRTQRSAAVREARVDNPSGDRLSRNVDRSGPDAQGGRTRTFTNDNARGAEPLNRGSAGGRPTDPSERSSIDAAPNRRVPNRDDGSAPSTRSSRPVTSPERAQRPEQPSTREGSPQRPSVDSARRPEVNRPETTRPEPVRPNTNTTRPATPQRPTVDSSSRPEVIRPNTNTTRPATPQRQSVDSSSRPEVIRPNANTARPVAPQRPSVDATSRPEAIRPQNVAPQRPSSVQRQTIETRPRTAEPQRQVTTSRPQVQARPEVNSVQRPSVSQQRMQIEAPQRPSVARPSSPAPQRYEQPSRQAAPQAPSRESSTRSAAPSRQEYSAPSRQSAPAPSYSAPSRQSSPRVQAPSSSPSRGNSGGPSRSSSPSPSRGNPRG